MTNAEATPGSAGPSARPPARRPGIEYRFSLAEVLVAVAIDAVLAAALLDVPRVLRGGKPQMLLLLVFLVYIVVPFVVAPGYLVTRRIHRRRPLAWHSRRNDFLMYLNFALPLLSVLGQGSTYRGSFGATGLVLLFVPIASTLFMVYSMIVIWMRARSRVHRQGMEDLARESADNERESCLVEAPSDESTS